MNKLLVKTKIAKDKFMRNAKRVLKNTEGDQITGWLIVILIVVVVGAFFMKNYQDAIVEVWDGVIAKIKSRSVYKAMKKEIQKKSRRLSAFLKVKKKGSAYYELIIKTLVFITLIATAVSFFSIFTVYLNLNYTCRRVVREIEISGQVTSNTNALFNQLKNGTNIGAGANMSVSASYFNAAQKKIQLRNTFDVTCTTSYRFDVFTPLGRDPIGFTIPMKVRMTGMSEKFWK